MFYPAGSLKYQMWKKSIPRLPENKLVLSRNHFSGMSLHNLTIHCYSGFA